MIEGIPSRFYLKERKRVMPFLENFSKRSLNRWTVEQLERDIMAADKQCWKIGDYQGVCLTSVGADAVNIEACAGLRRHEWQEALDDTLKQWAKDLGKSRIIALVRPGWEKFGKNRGYRTKHIEMVLEL